MRLLAFLEALDDRTKPSPIQHITGDSREFMMAYDRADDVIFPYMKQQGMGMRDRKIAQEQLSTKARVPIAQLIGTETHLDPRGPKSTGLPSIYKVGGKLYIGDGNHRVVQAHEAGEQEIDVKLLDVDRLEQATMAEDGSLELPTLDTGDELMVGKFKNSKAIIKGFTKDKHNQPIAKTDKGDKQIFKGRVKKLMTPTEA